MDGPLRPTKRPRLALFELASCAGCQLQILNCEDELVDLLQLVEFVYFKEAISETGNEYDIALIEGAVTREADETRLRAIRERAPLVITLGACAHPVGIPGLKNAHDSEEPGRLVYGDAAGYFPSTLARPVDAIIPVDAHIPGCPIHKDEFLSVVTALLVGRRPPIPGYPVCVECRLAENPCAFDRGALCLGPVTRAGCGALCPSYGSRCYGCRGPADDPNVSSFEALLEKNGLNAEDVLAEYVLYNGYRALGDQALTMEVSR
ncbi:MAG: NADH:ubiquinone oxidoreductase [Thermoleophilia bacterium]|nr:NADH:ubiquinone oxidoreductase [Thermoleophilia bacterium]